jgi:hypothetical protein
MNLTAEREAPITNTRRGNDNTHDEHSRSTQMLLFNQKCDAQKARHGETSK